MKHTYEYAVEAEKAAEEGKFDQAFVSALLAIAAALKDLKPKTWATGPR